MSESISNAESAPRDLREACVAEALRIIDEVGLEGLSIREVARRLGVSHQAPYKHFPSLDHLLAEIVRRTYAMFSAHLEARPRSGVPAQDMQSLGEAYFQFAMQHPLYYRLIFGTPLPDPQAHPEMMREAKKAFTVLLDSLKSLHGLPADAKAGKQLQLQALFVWSTVHGLSTILQTAAWDQLGLEDVLASEALPFTLACIGKAVGAETPSK